MAARTIIGVDFAVDPADTGLALGTLSGQGTTVPFLDDVKTGADESPTDLVADWLGKAKKDDEPALIAIDAPLGWPNELSLALSRHMAGERVGSPAHRLFERETERDVARLKKPQAVGAEKIARVAYAALNFLADLRNRVSSDIPLAWDCRNMLEVSAIEVYPASTLKAYSLTFDGYKKTSKGTKEEKRAKRNEITEGLLTDRGPEMCRLGMKNPVREQLIDNDDLLDAAVCVLAAMDFLTGHTVEPGRAKQWLYAREGWIWARREKAELYS